MKADHVRGPPVGPLIIEYGDYERQEHEMSTSDTDVGRNSMEIVKSFITTWNKHDINATMGLSSPESEPDLFGHSGAS